MQGSAIWLLTQAIWADRKLIFGVTAFAIFVAVLVLFRPDAPKTSGTVVVQVESRFLPSDEIVSLFMRHWMRSPLWDELKEIHTDAPRYDKVSQKIALEVSTTDETSRSVEAYVRAIQGEIDKFEAAYLADARARMNELYKVKAQSVGSDYVASTEHKLLLAIDDATSDHGLLSARAVDVELHAHTPASVLSSLSVAAVLGVLFGLALSVGRLAWAQGGKPTPEENTDFEPEQEEAQAQR